MRWGNVNSVNINGKRGYTYGYEKQNCTYSMNPPLSNNKKGKKKVEGS